MISYDPDGRMIFPGLAPGCNQRLHKVHACCSPATEVFAHQRAPQTLAQPMATMTRPYRQAPRLARPGPSAGRCGPNSVRFGSPIPFDISAIQESAELSDQPAHCRHASEASRPRHVSFRGIMPLAAEAPG